MLRSHPLKLFILTDDDDDDDDDVVVVVVVVTIGVALVLERSPSRSVATKREMASFASGEFVAFFPHPRELSNGDARDLEPKPNDEKEEDGGLEEDEDDEEVAVDDCLVRIYVFQASVRKFLACVSLLQDLSQTFFALCHSAWSFARVAWITFLSVSRYFPAVIRARAASE